jgi:geranylgeranyl diphosphate synthase type II
LPAALAVEVFIIFRCHDDIMDAALRRGHTTVHEKWDLNTEFYLGMCLWAYQYFENYQPKNFGKLAKFFSKTAYKFVKVSNGMSILRLETMLLFREYPND